MKKFLSAILSLSLTFSATTVTFAYEGNDTFSKGYWSVNSKMLFMWDGAKKFYGETLGILGTSMTLLDQLGQIGFRLSGIKYGIDALTSLGLAGKNLYEKVKLKFSKINQDVNTVVKELDKELQCIKGQEKAKKKMKDTVAAIIDARNEAEENGKPYGKGDVIYMPGPSGVGKTFSAECLARAIMGPKAEPIRIDSSCFEKTSSTSLKAQILYMRDQQKNSGSMNYYIDNSLAAKIASNPNMVLIFDEYDKWCTPETDELLRTIMDKGMIYRDGDRINCSGLLVIVLSNEDHSSVTEGNGKGTHQDDGTGSRTHVVHDQSFLNRLNIIEFDNLYEDDYTEITQDQLQFIAERYKKSCSVDFDFGNVARKIAIKVARLNKGAREIAKILGGLRKAIIVEKQKSADSFKNKVYKVAYDPNEDEFTLKEKTSENEPDEDFFEIEPEPVGETKDAQEVKSEMENESEEENLKETESEPVSETQEFQEGKTELENENDAENSTEENVENIVPEVLEETRESTPKNEQEILINEPETEGAKG